MEAETEQKTASDPSVRVEGVVMPRKFEMCIEPHAPENPDKPCHECVLSHGWMCLDRTYCEFPKTGKTWKKVAA